MYHTKIVLYELSSGLPDGKPLSPWSGTVRCALNYRKLAHRSELVPLRDFQALAAKLGAQPTTTFPDGSPKYTTPTIVDETSGTRVILSESMDILKYIESTYPDPAHPMFTSLPMDRLAQSTILDLLFPVMNGLDIRATYASVPDADKPTWRKRWLAGKDIEDFVLSKDSEKYQQQLKEGEANWTKLAGFLEAPESESPWLGGRTPVFADFFLLAALSMTRYIWVVEWENTFSKVAGGRFQEYLEAGEEYLKFTTS